MRIDVLATPGSDQEDRPGGLSHYLWTVVAWQLAQSFGVGLYIRLAIVIEFGDRAQGRPAYGRVAIAAGNFERPMRVARRTPLKVLPEHPRQHAGQTGQ